MENEGGENEGTHDCRQGRAGEAVEIGGMLQAKIKTKCDVDSINLCVCICMTTSKARHEVLIC
jgi:hypothetical protein